MIKAGVLFMSYCHQVANSHVCMLNDLGLDEDEEVDGLLGKRQTLASRVVGVAMTDRDKLQSAMLTAT